MEDEINSTTVNVSGIGTSESVLELYLEDVVIKSVQVSKAGHYSTSFTMNNPVNYKNYTVKVVDKNSADVTASNTFVYSETVPVIEQFTMDYNNNTYELLNAVDVNPIITFVPNCDMRFTVAFDHPSDISSVEVVSERNNVKKYIKAMWDESQQAFVATGQFKPEDPNYVPGKLSVDYMKKKLTVAPQQAVDFTTPLFTNNLPADAKSTEVTVIENSSDRVAVNLNFNGSLETLMYDEVEMVVTETTKVYSQADILGYMKSTDQLLAYFAKGYNDEQYILNLDYSDSETVVIFVHDISSNKLITTTVKVADETLEHVDLQKALGSLGVISEATGIIVNMYEIETNDQMLNDRIWSSNMTYAEKLEAVEKAETLMRDREMFLGMTTIMSLAVSEVDTPAAGLMFNLFLGAITTSSSYFRDARMAGIVSGGTEFNATWRWRIDPSGYVYEAIEDNRLEGVTTTAYWKQTEKDEPVQWDATEWDQINPIITDNNGCYAWDVPEGLWRVKYEKEGYETTWSQWLPVPPPQTDINIGILSNEAPAVEAVTVDGNKVIVTFTKYLQLTSININNIYLLKNSTKMNTIIETLDEKNQTTDNVYTKTVVLTVDEAEAIGNVTLVAKKALQSYNDVTMTSDYNEVLNLSGDLFDINHDGVVNIIDVSLLYAYYGLVVGDLNDDGIVDIKDFVLLMSEVE